METPMAAQEIIPRHAVAGPAVAAALVFVALAGCETDAQQRVKHYRDDGIYLFGQGQYQAARETFAAALELQPEDPTLFYNLGQCCDRLGDSSKAEQYYQEALKRSPNHGDARHALAALLYRLGRKEHATEMIRDWLEREPNLADAYALDGWRLRQDNALPDAQGRLHQALALDPHNVRANVELGIVYETMNLPERSLVLYERALAQNPKQPEVSGRVETLRLRKVSRPLPD
jgi:tetratricopeptide (TPR) repeat protein